MSKKLRKVVFLISLLRELSSVFVTSLTWRCKKYSFPLYSSCFCNHHSFDLLVRNNISQNISFMHVHFIAMKNSFVLININVYWPPYFRLHCTDEVKVKMLPLAQSLRINLHRGLCLKRNRKNWTGLLQKLNVSSASVHLVGNQNWQIRNLSYKFLEGHRIYSLEWK